MAFKLIESAQAHGRAVNAPHLVALVRAGARFEKGQFVERTPTNQEAMSEKAAMRPVGLSVRERFGCLNGAGRMDGLRHAGWAGR